MIKLDKKGHETLGDFYMEKLKNKPENQIKYIEANPEKAYRVFSIFGCKPGLKKIIRNCKESNPWLVYHIAQELGEPIEEPIERKFPEENWKFSDVEISGHLNHQVRTKKKWDEGFNPLTQDIAYYDGQGDSKVLISKRAFESMESARNY